MSKNALRYTNEAHMPPGMRKLVAKQSVKAASNVASAASTLDSNAAGWLPKAPGKAVGRGKGRHVPGEMNKTEARYAQHLERQRVAGQILWFSFETWTFKIAKDCRYTPDFMVMLANGEIEGHEVKGRKGDRYWAEEDGKIKSKVAAATIPLRFKIVWPGDGDTWREEVL